MAQLETADAAHTQYFRFASPETSSASSDSPEVQEQPTQTTASVPVLFAWYHQLPLPQSKEVLSFM